MFWTEPLMNSSDTVYKVCASIQVQIFVGSITTYPNEGSALNISNFSIFFFSFLKTFLVSEIPGSCLIDMNNIQSPRKWSLNLPSFLSNIKF